MKIGLITFHKVNNIGAVLQATALLSTIRSTGADCEIIDFRPNNSAAKHSCVWDVLRFIKKGLLYNRKKQVYQREKRFVAFCKKHYVLSEKTYWGDQELEKNPPSYDLLISGSDQIFNTTLSGTSRSYYLTFASDTPKVSYASSFGRDKITPAEEALVREELPKFRHISVREKSAGKIIEDLTGMESEQVLDPVFLLDKCTWESYCNREMSIPYKHYIFVYSMENSEKLERLVKCLQEETALPVIVVRGGGQPGRISGTEDASCGPAEFLRYIKDADYVITNSFHGLAFSLLFEKKFFCVSHSKRNARLENLMDMVDEKNKVVASVDFGSNLQSFLCHGEVCCKKLSTAFVTTRQYLDKILCFEEA